MLTGAPGSSKTSLTRALDMGGFRVVEEAATGPIALGQAQGDGALGGARLPGQELSMAMRTDPRLASRIDPPGCG